MGLHSAFCTKGMALCRLAAELGCWAFILLITGVRRFPPPFPRPPPPRRLYKNKEYFKKTKNTRAAYPGGICMHADPYICAYVLAQLSASSFQLPASTFQLPAYWINGVRLRWCQSGPEAIIQCLGIFRYLQGGDFAGDEAQASRVEW